MVNNKLVFHRDLLRLKCFGNIRNKSTEIIATMEGSSTTTETRENPEGLDIIMRTAKPCDSEQERIEVNVFIDRRGSKMASVTCFWKGHDIYFDVFDHLGKVSCVKKALRDRLDYTHETDPDLHLSLINANDPSDEANLDGDEVLVTLGEPAV